MSNQKIDLGPVSAYALAKEYGYTGTEKEFAIDLANAAIYARNAREQADIAEAKAIAAAKSEAVTEQFKEEVLLSTAEVKELEENIEQMYEDITQKALDVDQKSQEVADNTVAAGRSALYAAESELNAGIQASASLESAKEAEKQAIAAGQSLEEAKKQADIAETKSTAAAQSEENAKKAAEEAGKIKEENATLIYKERKETTIVELNNTESYPFNNSTKTVALSEERDRLDYQVYAEVMSATGFVGDIEISDKQLNGFKIGFTGGASAATIRYVVEGGFD